MGSRSKGKKKPSPSVAKSPDPPVDEGITDHRKSKDLVVEGMVMTPDAHSSGNKSILDVSDQRNIYHTYVKREDVQCRVFQKHSSHVGRLDVGVPCDGSKQGGGNPTIDHEHVESVRDVSDGDVRDYLPSCVDSLSKEGSRKKEDKWLVKRENRWSCGDGCDVNVGVWGVFDGHGGRQVATYASHALIKYVAEFCSEPVNEQHGSGHKGFLDDGIHSDLESTSDDMALISPRILDEHVSRPDEHDVERVLGNDACMQQWSSQCELMKRLPMAVHNAFLKCDEMACKQFSHGGTTATIAFVCGWQLLVANVGDSCAYLDTGSEVLAISGNHRLEDNAEEVSRIEKNGGEVAPSSIDGKPAGPIRVWPGGLAMSRTIGDVDAGRLCLADAEITQVTIPQNGARLIIASDGLWDAVHPKTAAHHTRDMKASEASHKLLSMAIKKDRLKDDVTIIVVDILPPLNGGDSHDHSHLIPRGLHLYRPAAGKKARGKSNVEKLARLWHPLTKSGSTTWVEEDLLRRAEVHHECKLIQEENLILHKRQEEIRNEATQVEEEKRSGKKVSLLEELANLTLAPEDFEGGQEWETVSKHQIQQEQKSKKYRNTKRGKKKKNNSDKAMDETQNQPAGKKIVTQAEENKKPMQKAPLSEAGKENSNEIKKQNKKNIHQKKKFYKKTANASSESQGEGVHVQNEGGQTRRFYAYKKKGGKSKPVSTNVPQNDT